MKGGGEGGWVDGKRVGIDGEFEKTGVGCEGGCGWLEIGIKGKEKTSMSFKVYVLKPRKT